MKLLGLFSFVNLLLAPVLGASAVLTPVAALHVAFAIGVLPLIFGAMLHFVPVLTRSAGPHRAIAVIPFLVAANGFSVVLAMQGLLPRGALHVAATLDLLFALTLIGWILRRARRTLGAPHPGWRWYAAALSMLVLALLVVPPLASGIAPGMLRLFHLHANTAGLIGLAALGTLPVLLPTALGKPDPQAAPWLRRRLPVAVAGALFLATGAALWWPLSLVGGALLAVLALGLFAHWWRLFGVAKIISDGAAAPLAGATAVFGLLFLGGALHGSRLVDATGMTAAFVAGFLLPLVSGALSQLLPVGRFTGPNSPARQEMRRRLVRCGRSRAVLFPLAGLAFLVALPAAGLALLAAGLLLFTADLFAALRVPAPAR